MSLFRASHAHGFHCSHTILQGIVNNKLPHIIVHQVCQISFSPLPPCINPKTIDNQICFEEEEEAFGYLSNGIIKSPDRQLEGFLM
jgi:hypothetical protein